MNSYYNYDTAAGLLSSLIFFVFSAAGYVLYSFFYMKIFEKAGVQGKWRAWVPVYRELVFLKLGDLSPWLYLYLVGAFLLGVIIPFLGWFLLLPLAGLAYRVVTALAAYRIGQKLQKEGAWVVLYIFVDIVWLGIMAFDKSRWNAQIAPAPWAGNSFFADRTVWEGIPVQSSAAAAPGAAPGYGAPQGYQQAGGYPQQAPAQQPPAPGYQPPAAPATPPAAPGAPTPPPAAPSAPPVAPATPPTTPPPAAPPAPPADPNQPPA